MSQNRPPNSHLFEIPFVREKLASFSQTPIFKKQYFCKSCHFVKSSKTTITKLKNWLPSTRTHFRLAPTSYLSSLPSANSKCVFLKKCISLIILILNLGCDRKQWKCVKTGRLTEASDTHSATNTFAYFSEAKLAILESMLFSIERTHCAFLTQEESSQKLKRTTTFKRAKSFPFCATVSVLTFQIPICSKSHLFASLLYCVTLKLTATLTLWVQQ